MVKRTECNGQNKPCRMVWIESQGWSFPTPVSLLLFSHRPVFHQNISEWAMSKCPFRDHCAVDKMGNSLANNPALKGGLTLVFAAKLT